MPRVARDLDAPAVDASPARASAFSQPLVMPCEYQAGSRTSSQRLPSTSRAAEHEQSLLRALVERLGLQLEHGLPAGRLHDRRPVGQDGVEALLRRSARRAASRFADTAAGSTSRARKQQSSNARSGNTSHALTIVRPWRSSEPPKVPFLPKSPQSPPMAGKAWNLLFSAPGFALDVDALYRPGDDDRLERSARNGMAKRDGPDGPLPPLLLA